jgi:NAD+ synthase (glutamine-hydrolysing)
MMPAALMKIAVAQINTTVGDFAGNEARIRDAYRRGVAAGADVVVFPELATCGYPPRDLLARPHFVEANLEMLQRLAAETGRTALVLGYVDRNEQRPGRELRNSVALLAEGAVRARRHKTLLPSYDVFDEDRYFEPARENLPVPLHGQLLGLTVCEDLWNDGDFWRDARRYDRDPAEPLVAAGARILLNASASPWQLGKAGVRRDMLATLARDSKCPVVYCNLVGGNDELIFDGGSLVFNAAGELIARGASFEEDFLLVNLETAPAVSAEVAPDEASVFDALVLGVRDYFGKCGF